jgi:hypothetical protein
VKSEIMSYAWVVKSELAACDVLSW